MCVGKLKLKVSRIRKSEVTLLSHHFIEVFVSPNSDHAPVAVYRNCHFNYCHYFDDCLWMLSPFATWAYLRTQNRRTFIDFFDSRCRFVSFSFRCAPALQAQAMKIFPELFRFGFLQVSDETSSVNHIILCFGDNLFPYPPRCIVVLLDFNPARPE